MAQPHPVPRRRYLTSAWLVLLYETQEKYDLKTCLTHINQTGYKNSGATVPVDGENSNFVKMDPFRVFDRAYYQGEYR